jgi:hypothetical protein
MPVRGNAPDGRRFAYIQARAESPLCPRSRLSSIVTKSDDEPGNRDEVWAAEISMNTWTTPDSGLGDNLEKLLHGDGLDRFGVNRPMHHSFHQD